MDADTFGYEAYNYVSQGRTDRFLELVSHSRFAWVSANVRDGRVGRYGFQRHMIAPNGPSSPAVKAVLDRYRAAR